MHKSNKLQRLFEQLFLKPIEKKKRRDYKQAWRINDDTDLCEILQKMQWMNEELRDINSGAVVGFAEIHYGERKYWSVSSLKNQPQSRLIFLTDHVGREGRRKVPCVAFLGDQLYDIAELLIYHLQIHSEKIKEVVFGHTKQFFQRQPQAFEFSNHNGGEEIANLVRENYTPHMHNCVRVAFNEDRDERDVTFAELDQGTMISGYIPFKFLLDNL